MKKTCENPWFDEKFLVHLRSFSEKMVNTLISIGIVGEAPSYRKMYDFENQAAATYSIRTGIKTFSSLSITFW